MSVIRTGRLVDEQLNGGEYFELTDADWKLIMPYLAGK